MTTSDPLASERIYHGLKDMLLRNMLQAGSRIDASALADRFGASASPVRDAIHRLLGERLVEALPHGGFRVRPMTEVRLRALYRWQVELASCAVRMAPPSHDFSADLPRVAERNTSDIAYMEGCRWFFRTISEAADNMPLLVASGAVADQLAPAWMTESTVMLKDRLAPEPLDVLILAGGRGAIRAYLSHYLRVRERSVSYLIEAMAIGPL
jgi:hypothetical protein